MADALDLIARQLAKGGKNIAFTGAGISTESGISDYRSKGGIWDRFKPIYFDEFMSSRKARIEYWRRRIELHGELDPARPNAAHRSLARLHALSRLEAVITQNIDGLHQAAGLPDDKVIELHGNTRRVRCMSCSAVFPLTETLARIQEGDPAPECTCGGYLKPDTISFGQSLRETDLNRAMALASSANVFLVVGSTLIVQPASMLPGYALRAGAFLAIVNLSETPYDDACQVLIREPAGSVLPEIAARVEQSLSTS